MGAALSVWSSREEVKKEKIKLDNFCTVFQAELYVIYRATKLTTCIDKICIISDSRSALDIIVDPDSFQPIAFAIRRELYDNKHAGKEIKLTWIKAHAGHIRNERADDLVKEAALKIKAKATYDRCPISFDTCLSRLPCISNL